VKNKTTYSVLRAVCTVLAVRSTRKLASLLTLVLWPQTSFVLTVWCSYSVSTRRACYTGVCPALVG